MIAMSTKRYRKRIQLQWIFNSSKQRTSDMVNGRRFFFISLVINSFYIPISISLFIQSPLRQLFPLSLPLSSEKGVADRTFLFARSEEAFVPLQFSTL